MPRRRHDAAPGAVRRLRSHTTSSTRGPVSCARWRVLSCLGGAVVTTVLRIAAQAPASRGAADGRRGTTTCDPSGRHLIERQQRGVPDQINSQRVVPREQDSMASCVTAVSSAQGLRKRPRDLLARDLTQGLCGVHAGAPTRRPESFSSCVCRSHNDTVLAGMSPGWVTAAFRLRGQSHVSSRRVDSRSRPVEERKAVLLVRRAHIVRNDIVEKPQLHRTTVRRPSATNALHGGSTSLSPAACLVSPGRALRLRAVAQPCSRLLLAPAGSAAPRAGRREEECCHSRTSRSRSISRRGAALAGR